MGKHHDTLGVASDADDTAIKAAYIKLVKENHPDTHPDDKGAGERLKKINEAYDQLKKGNPGHPGGTPEDIEAMFRNMGFTGGFESFFHNVRSHQINLNQTIAVPLEQLVSGSEWNARYVIGEIINQKIILEPNTPVGTVYSFKHERGSAKFTVVARGNTRFEIDMDQISVLHRCKVDALMMIVGCDFNVVSFDGSTIKVSLPAATANGAVMRLVGKGLKHVSGRVGDLFLKIEAEIPKLDSDLCGRIKKINEERLKTEQADE